MNHRPMCKACNKVPAAVNYIDKKGKRHYRKKCDACNRIGRRLRPKPTTWQLSGYKKKPQCEMCGFKAKLPEQMIVFYVDGDRRNGNWQNLRTICWNCQIEISHSNLKWVKDDQIKPDF